MSQRHTTQRDINATLRAKQALDLRKQGLTLAQIAEQCGFQDKSGAWRAIKRELDRIPAESVTELRKLELMRIDQMFAECWTLAMDKKNKGRLFAMDRMITLSQDRRKLMGLDTPVDSAVAANMVIVREIPNQYLTGPGEVKSD